MGTCYPNFMANTEYKRHKYYVVQELMSGEATLRLIINSYGPRDHPTHIAQEEKVGPKYYFGVFPKDGFFGVFA